MVEKMIEWTDMKEQFFRFHIGLDAWDDDKRWFGIDVGKLDESEDGENSKVHTSFRLNKSQYSELLRELRSYNEGSERNFPHKIFEITEPPNDVNFVLSCNLDDINVQLFFENKNEILEFTRFLSRNKVTF